jgi:hypothetical protein
MLKYRLVLGSSADSGVYYLVRPSIVRCSLKAHEKTHKDTDNFLVTHKHSKLNGY